MKSESPGYSFSKSERHKQTKEGMSSRDILQKIPAQGFCSAKTESIALTSSSSGSKQWQRMFVGSSDGALALYECTPEQPRSGNPYAFELVQMTREAARDKKSPAFNFNIAEVLHTFTGFHHQNYHVFFPFLLTSSFSHFLIVLEGFIVHNGWFAYCFRP